ncbi:hypothetical protein F5X68DRAFT_234509 [Plectosphaerella plurivora]|uniref:Xylanolytic transcriptional activator regulatory domain-containing protein n=1 Tax=Plectosphaerella plurivora TaxID=936078 RepID=A0A9P9A678_9PEZI|nr:hypothetical protein F5X68DRAFT_234509 [Plectosphaerella plurivora]
MADAITTYFRCSHRQPVWLFERAEELTQDTAEELSLVVLGISLQYSQQDSPPFHNTTLQAPSTYTDAARSLIMLKLANATVAMQTLQALCLLATSNLVAGDLQLAAFHSSLLANLLQSSGLEARASSPDRVDPAIEEARRLFWSLQSQISMCALPIHIPSTLDIESPAFSIPDEPSSRPGGKAPLLPVEAPGDAQPQTDRSLGIWAHQVRSASLWALVRAHVSRCAEGDTAKTSSLPPWHPQSDYTVINALLLDMECAFPISFRYDAARFPFRSPESIERRREFWLPWMRIQVGYHTLHAVLNHPFLYSSRVSSPHPGPNAFWKTSTDLALLHSTWIARLIGMAGEKGLELSDPFFVHAAAVAVTLHLYWSRAADPKIHAPAKENLSEAVQEAVSSNTIMPAPELRQQNLTADYPGWAWNPATDTGIFYNPFTQFGDRSGGADMSWWDCGNL